MFFGEIFLRIKHATFKGIVSRDLEICFFVKDLTLLPLPERVQLLLIFHFRVKF
jgi:hypothetical protein